MLVASGGTKLLQARKFLFPLRVNGFQANTLAGEGNDAASGKNIDGKVDRNCAGMKQVERPDVEGTARQIHPAGGVRNDRSVFRQNYSVKKCAIWRKLL